MRAALGLPLPSGRAGSGGRTARSSPALGSSLALRLGSGSSFALRLGGTLALGSLLAVGSGCGALRQNLRNQFVSYRGAWSCESAGCKSSEVVQSKSGRASPGGGELRINDVKLQPHAGLAFYPGTPVKAMTATVRDCKGKSKDVPSDKVQPPGRHKIKAEPDSWVIWLDEALVSDLEVSEGDCAVLTVKTHSTWDDGSVYDAEGAIAVAR